MKVMPFIQCPGCMRIIQLVKDDLIERLPNIEYRAICCGDLCKHEFRVPLEMARDLMDEVLESVEDTRVEEKKLLKGVQARKALKDAGGVKAQAAKNLGISAPTLNKYLEYPTPEVPDGIEAEATNG